MQRRLIAAIAAVILAGIGAILLFNYVSSADARAMAGQEPTQVLVVTKDIPAGTLGKTLGGSSSINAMCYIRGVAADYDGWAEASGDPRWSWREVLQPYVANRWQLRELTVNYRTPSEIMRYATRVLGRIGDAATAPTSLRSNGIQPTSVTPDAVGQPTLEDAVVAVSRHQHTGLTAVIVPEMLYRSVSAAVAGAGLDDPPRVYTVRTAKGLEFDTTVVVEPSAIIGEADGPEQYGYSDLYVALTRATQCLLVVHAQPLPDELADMPTEPNPTPAD